MRGVEDARARRCGTACSPSCATMPSKRLAEQRELRRRRIEPVAAVARHRPRRPAARSTKARRQRLAGRQRGAGVDDDGRERRLDDRRAGDAARRRHRLEPVDRRPRSIRSRRSRRVARGRSPALRSATASRDARPCAPSVQRDPRAPADDLDLATSGREPRTDLVCRAWKSRDAARRRRPASAIRPPRSGTSISQIWCG